MTDSTRSTRRKVLTALPAVTLAALVASPAFVEARQEREPRASPELRMLIETHRKAYATLMRSLHRSADRSYRGTADRIEQEALLAVCAFPARSDADRHVKAEYLLDIEERGELDLPQHIQAILRSMS